MTDRPILFSGPMVRALLDGQKTQTRRVLKPQPIVPVDHMFHTGVLTANGYSSFEPHDERGRAINGYIFPKGNGLGLYVVDVPYAVGDRLWVRERMECANGESVGYPADGSWLPNTLWQWKRASVPSIHVPRWASRLTLIVTDVRVQRLQEINEADAQAEGWPGPATKTGFPIATSVQWFSSLWDSLNGRRGFGWDADPWVVALTFTAHRVHIDQMAKQ